MFRTVGDQVSLWEAVLPPELLRLPDELARVDALRQDARQQVASHRKLVRLLERGDEAPRAVDLLRRGPVLLVYDLHLRRVDAGRAGEAEAAGPAQPGAVAFEVIEAGDRVAIEQRLASVAAQADQPEVHLRPNKLVVYKHVAMIMATAQRLGVTKIGIVGNEQFL